MAAKLWFRPEKGWKANKRKEFAGYGNSNDPSHFNTEVRQAAGVGSTPVRPNSYVLDAIYDITTGGIGATHVGDEVFALEKKYKDDRTFVGVYNINNGALSASMVSKMGPAGLGKRGEASDDFDYSPFFALFLLALRETNVSFANLFSAVQASWDANKEFPKEETYQLADGLYYLITKDLIEIKTQGETIDPILNKYLERGAYSGDVICGSPELLLGKKGSKKAKQGFVRLEDAMKEFESFREMNLKARNYTPEELALIGAGETFDKDTPVPPEVRKIANAYVKSRSFDKPMTNFGWRGGTSYGKSTGIAMLSCMLGIPLVRFTCDPDTDRAQLLTEIIPYTEKAEKKEVELNKVSFEEISFDPPTAYQKITGKKKHDATPNDCLQAIYEAKASAPALSDAPQFKLVESTIVRGMKNGYIVEIQEASRIKSPGVLVGLNEFDRAGALIPLADGSFARRHPDAMVCFTDNVGYVSCRQLDPSVIRRMAVIIDSGELPEEEALRRVTFNTGYGKDASEKSLLKKMYSLWKQILEFCDKEEITEGSCSITELENWVKLCIIDDFEDVEAKLKDCVVSKCTSVKQEQESIMNNVVKLEISKII